MEIDPHTIQQLLVKIREQLHCPQCTRKINVQLDSLKVLSETFAVFQIKCPTCDAYIMLHASIATSHTSQKSTPRASESLSRTTKGWNVSTSLELGEEEMHALRKDLRSAGGSFSKIFESGE